jgi:hypothetical protein
MQECVMALKFIAKCLRRYFILVFCKFVLKLFKTHMYSIIDSLVLPSGHSG